MINFKQIHNTQWDQLELFLRRKKWQKILKNHYNININLNSFHYRRLYGGFRNLSFKLENKPGPDQYTATIYNYQNRKQPEIAKALQLENLLLTKKIKSRPTILNKHQQLVTTITCNNQKYYLSLQTYVSGEQLHFLKLNQIQSLGKLLKKVHQALQNQKGKPVQNEDQTLHHDFGRGNILFIKQQPQVVIDFEEHIFGHPSQDIAKALSFLYVDQKQTFKNIQKQFLTGYGPKSLKWLPLINKLEPKYVQEILKPLIKRYSPAQQKKHPTCLRAEKFLKGTVTKGSL